jgi:hypothetical protein
MARTNHLTTLALGLLLAACNKPLPPPDPNGKDIVEGAVVAAVTTAEKEPGVRTYKVVHVDDYPEPIGHNYHLIAYDPKASSFEEARDIRARGSMKVVMGHVEVRAFDFLKRDHRVIAKEAVTNEERAPYEKSRDSRR